MIISASRRTDIPAFYSTWFMKRLHEGFVLVPNPFNTKQISKVSLCSKDVECFVFWTKNARPMMKYMETVKKLPCYFQFTITAYEKDVEPFLPSKKDIIQTFQELSLQLGKNRTIWRYDPILLTPKYTIGWHIQKFDEMMRQLAPYTDCCVISFLDMYKKTERNTLSLLLQPITPEQMQELAEKMATICRKYHITLQTCAEDIDLDTLGICHGACIDKQRIEQVIHCALTVKKDTTQRGRCGCVKSVDIGQYNTCMHMCRYCYANFNGQQVKNNCAVHNDDSPLLTGHIPEGAKITERKVEHWVKSQNSYEEMSLF